MIINKVRNIKNEPAAIRLILFLIFLVINWLPAAIIINLLLKADSNTTTIVIMGLLFCDFVFLQNWLGIHIYQEQFLFKKYGLKTNRLSFIYLIKGLAIGFILCWGLFITESIFGWLYISNNSDFLLKTIAEGSISGLGIALAEELFFRGWILYELEQDYSKSNALWISSILFAVAHFLKPISEIKRTLITFPALLLLGLILVWSKRSYKNYLTISIGIHGGLVWGYYVLNVGNLVTYTNRVPEWITGIDSNPIAGILGLSFLSVLALIMQKKADEANT